MSLGRFADPPLKSSGAVERSKRPDLWESSFQWRARGEVVAKGRVEVTLKKVLASAGVGGIHERAWREKRNRRTARTELCVTRLVFEWQKL